jgi:hypothetical protein
VNNAHVSRIINWEHAGYYPEWWEYAKANLWIEEAEWRYYMMKELGNRFGYFPKESEFARDFKELQKEQWKALLKIRLTRGNSANASRITNEQAEQARRAAKQVESVLKPTDTVT